MPNGAQVPRSGSPVNRATKTATTRGGTERIDVPSAASRPPVDAAGHGGGVRHGDISEPPGLRVRPVSCGAASSWGSAPGRGCRRCGQRTPPQKACGPHPPARTSPVPGGGASRDPAGHRQVPPFQREAAGAGAQVQHAGARRETSDQVEHGSQVRSQSMGADFGDIASKTPKSTRTGSVAIGLENLYPLCSLVRPKIRVISDPNFGDGPVCRPGLEAMLQ